MTGTIASLVIRVPNDLFADGGKGSRRCRDYRGGKKSRVVGISEHGKGEPNGWKFAIKIPAVALRWKREEERGSEGAGPAVSCVRTLVAFKPPSAFKLAPMPIRGPLHAAHVFLRAAASTVLLSFRPRLLSHHTITFDTLPISLGLINYSFIRGSLLTT